jgi:hypothetical protein
LKRKEENKKNLIIRRRELILSAYAFTQVSLFFLIYKEKKLHYNSWALFLLCRRGQLKKKEKEKTSLKRRRRRKKG